MTELELKQIMQASGILGAGGAGFPSYAKLSDKATTLVINCAECEPLIYTDYMLMRDHLAEVVGGVSAIMAASPTIKCAYMAMKEHTGTELGFVNDQVLADKVIVRFLPNAYPMGDEINLIYEATGILINPGELPISKGVIVYNTETVYNAYNAITKGEPVTEKWVTVAGNIKDKYVVKVPVGMKVSELLDKINVTIPEGNSLFDGGPSMGRIINPMTAVIGKTTKSLLVVPNTAPAIAHKKVNIEDMLRRAASCCCACSRCTEMCPRNLLGYPLEPHKMIRAAMSNAVLDNPELVKNATLCCSCGVCAEVCCQEISPKDVILHLKGILAKNKLRYTPDGKEHYASDDRAYRLIPSTRWQSMIGVKQLDGVPKLLKQNFSASLVEISMRSHIGAPSIPEVNVGDAVTVGQKIAKSADGLSLPQYASISGKVIFVSPEKVIIEA